MLGKIHRRNPCAQKVGTERQHHLGLVDIETRHFHAIGFLVCRAHHRWRDRLIDEMILASEAIQIITHQNFKMAAHTASQKCDLFAAHAFELVGNQRIGLVPTYRFALITSPQ